MSTDYYLICPNKKIYMPVFIMVAGCCSVVSKYWIFDFILICEGQPIELIDENNEKMPNDDDPEDPNYEEWTFMNAWYPHKDDKEINNEDHIKATEGVECRKDLEVIDETPMAYKDIDAVIAAQHELIEIVHTLKQIVCVKG
jgi:hypothetical protein